jgi:hypothetical protein
MDRHNHSKCFSYESLDLCNALPMHEVFKHTIKYLSQISIIEFLV